MVISCSYLHGDTCEVAPWALYLSYALFAAATAAFTSSSPLSGTFKYTSPVEGLKLSMCCAHATSFPSMKFSNARTTAISRQKMAEFVDLARAKMPDGFQGLHRPRLLHWLHPLHIPQQLHRLYTRVSLTWLARASECHDIAILRPAAG